MEKALDPVHLLRKTVWKEVLQLSQVNGISARLSASTRN